jgi:hypothetical protein
VICCFVSDAISRLPCDLARKNFASRFSISGRSSTIISVHRRIDPRRIDPLMTKIASTVTFDFDRLGASRFDVPASVHLKLDGTSQFLHLPTTEYLHSQRLGSSYPPVLQRLTATCPFATL